MSSSPAEQVTHRGSARRRDLTIVEHQGHRATRLLLEARVPQRLDEPSPVFAIFQGEDVVIASVHELG